MKKSKRLLALLLSVMFIFGAVCSVPFTASAAEIELEETGAYSLRFDTLKINGQHMQVDKDYYCMFNPDAKESVPLYAVLDTEEAGYYVLYARNSQLTTGDNTVTIGIVDEKEILDHSMGLANGEESELAVRLEANTRYYVKLCYNYEQDNYGSIDLKLSYFADAEPDERKPDISVAPGVAYEGSIDVAEDKDWIFVAAANNKKHSITLQNLNEEATNFVAEVYDTHNKLLTTVTTAEENTVTVDLEKPSDVVSYYICVTGYNTNVRGKYSVKMEEILPVSVEVPLNEEYYDTIAGFGTEGGRDYLKFTTIDKDAYYTITVKNIDIETHSWDYDTGVQVEILNANSEEISRIKLLPASEGAVTLKLQPDTTYYMQVYNNYLPDTKGGNYKVQISYVLDPDKNEMENSTEWTLEEKYYGDLAAGGDHDWFKITTNEETDYTFTLKNTNIPTHSWSVDQRFRGVIYNDKNESLATLMMFSGEELNTRVTLDPNTTYYIAIWDPEGTTGDYSFDLSKTVIIDEEAVGMANAVEIPYNEDYYDSITNWAGDNKTDYLKFTTLEEPAYYTLTVKNINIPTHPWHVDYQVQVKVWNEHKEELTKITLSEDYEASTTLMLDPNTTYYVRINNNEDNGGNYKVKLTYVTDPEPNTMEEAKLLRIGERYYSSIAASGDVDFFKITTNEATDYTLLIKNINIESHSWASDEIFRVVLMNKYSEILSEVLATTGKEEYTAITLEPNTTYYLKVVDPWDTKGDYNVLLAEGMLLGDVDLDEAVKIKDATLIQKYLAKLATLEGIQISAADVTEDGKVNIKDATAIQKYLAKIETSYKTGQLILSEIEYSEPATEATEPVTPTLSSMFQLTNTALKST
ncbi:MAG: dockerin type I repeat-containing protein [Ruminococcus sp.]|nr:dockerin type I repeat-containing protein [Ruminococcus sp.]